MNILPKKRWHVRTKDNIARVRRDEAQAAEEEKQRVNRAKLAEKEARTAFLRKKARLEYDGGYEETQPTSSNNTGQPSKSLEADIYTAQGNINFFKDVEEGKQLPGATNKETEAEKKAEQEKYEKSIGYLTYLGQGSVEERGGKAWYEQDAGRVVKKNYEHLGKIDNAEDKNDTSDIGEVGLKSKSRMDPIHDILKYGGFKPVAKNVTSNKPGTSDVVIPKPVNVIQKDVNRNDKTEVLELQKITTGAKVNVERKSKAKVKKAKKKHKKTKRSMEKKKSKIKRRRSYSSDESDDHESRRKRKRHKSLKRNSSDSDEEHNRKKHRSSKKKRKHRNQSDSSSSSDDSSSTEISSEDEEAAKEKQKKLEVLRAERLQREAVERKRAEKLLAGKKPDNEKSQEIIPAYKQMYNSQFNPHIARQNQEPTTLQPGVKYWQQ